MMINNQFLKSTAILFSGNIMAGFIGFISLSLLTYFGTIKQINYINYLFYLAPTVFTFIDFGRSNATLLASNKTSEPYDIFISIFQIFILIFPIVFLLVLNLNFQFILEIYFILTCFVIQKIYYSVLLKKSKEIYAVISQIILSFLKLFAVILIVIFNDYESYFISIIYGFSLFVFLFSYLIFFKNHLSDLYKKIFNRISDLWKDMKVIGPNNISLILLDRFEILFFIYILNDIEYASLVTIIGYSFLIGVVIDAIMKKLYVDLENQKFSNKILFMSFIKKYGLKFFLAIFLIFLAIYNTIDIIVINKFILIGELIIFSILFQITRFISQFIELDYFRIRSSKLIKLRMIFLFIFSCSLFICYYFDFSLFSCLVIFIIIRLFTLYLLIKTKTPIEIS